MKRAKNQMKTKQEYVWFARASAGHTHSHVWMANCILHSLFCWSLHKTAFSCIKISEEEELKKLSEVRMANLQTTHSISFQVAFLFSHTFGNNNYSFCRFLFISFREIKAKYV